MIIDDVAGAAVIDVVSVVNEVEDGPIVAVIEGIPTDITNAITNGWDSFTNEVHRTCGDVISFFEGGCSQYIVYRILWYASG